MNRILSAVCAAILCALAMAAPAAAEFPEYSDGWPMITGPESPENYVYRVDLGPNQELVQVSPTEVGVEYADGVMSFILDAGLAHDSEGASVPVTLAKTGADLVTLTVHHQEGNPAAGFAPYRYPIVEGAGWEGGIPPTTVVKGPPDEMEVEAERRAREARESTPPPAPAAEPTPGPVCTVPALHGFGLGAAKRLLRGADCGVGKVRLARGATKSNGKVVKQFEPAGTQLEAGAPIAVKLSGS